MNIEPFSSQIDTQQGLALATCEMERLFFSHKGGILHKWHHYLAIYDRWFAPYKNKPITILEIGVSGGGSLELWRKFFGTEARIIGVDIDPSVRDRAPKDAEIYIGDQGDRAFLENLGATVGEFDIIIDDGSHVNIHQILTFDVLFPRLKQGGLFVCEDLHTSYWKSYGGGFPKSGLFGSKLPKTWIEYVKVMIDQMHAWYASPRDKQPITALTRDIGGLHIYDSIAVFEKQTRGQPFHIIVGAEKKLES